MTNPFFNSPARPANPTDVFRKESLARNSPSNPNGVYVLSDESVSPTARRIVGRDAAGMPIEEVETIPAAYSRMWLTAEGNWNRVPMQSSVEYQTEDRYEQGEIKRLLQAGWIPRDTCPRTTAYRHVTGTRALVELDPNDHEECPGHPDGCPHLLAIVDARRARAKAKAQADEDAVTGMNQQQAHGLLKNLANAFGIVAERAETNEPAPINTTARNRARFSKSEGE